jgi:hypothetical protein
MSEVTFVDRCLRGEATLEDIEDFVETWHKGDDPRELHDYLGLTWDEYALSVERPNALRFVIFSRRHGLPLEEVLERYDSVEAAEPVAARAKSKAEAREVLAWLKKTGRVK